MPLGRCRWLERAKVVWRARQCRAPTVGKKRRQRAGETPAVRTARSKAPAGGQRYKGNGCAALKCAA